MYSLIPMICLALINTLLCLLIHHSSQRLLKHSSSSSSRQSTESMSSGKRNLNKTIIVSTILFMLMTLPTAIASFYFVQWFGTEDGDLYVLVFDNLSLTYHGCNFFVLFTFNKRFRRFFISARKSPQPVIIFDLTIDQTK